MQVGRPAGRSAVVGPANPSPFASGPSDGPFFNLREHEVSASAHEQCMTDCATRQDPRHALPLWGKPVEEGTAAVIGSLLVRNCSSISEEPGIPAIPSSGPSSAASSGHSSGRLDAHLSGGVPKQTSIGRQPPVPNPSPFARVASLSSGSS